MLAAVKCQRGLGLVELLIAVTVLGIIAAIATPSFSDMLNRRRVQAVATSISTDLAYLRTEQSLRPKDLTMYINTSPAARGTSCYAIGILQNLGDCASCWETDPNKVCTRSMPLVRAERLSTSTNVSFTASASKLKFDQLRLTPIPSNFSFDICGASSIDPRPVLRVELNAVGRAKICSPNGSISGYGSCTSGPDIQCPTS